MDLVLAQTLKAHFSLAIPTCRYLKTLKFALPTTQILKFVLLKFVLPPMVNPNASQWNIGCVGSQTQISGVVNFNLSISFALVANAN